MLREKLAVSVPFLRSLARSRLFWFGLAAGVLICGAVLAWRFWNGPRCVRGDCADGRGILLFRDGSMYSGDFHASEFHGQGEFRTPDGEHYRGEWLNGKRHGFGATVFADGGQFTGQFRANERHGRGTYIWPDGVTYSGGWRDGAPHGRGVLELTDRRAFAGEYRDGVIYEGAGMFVYDDGTRYIGAWRAGRRHGTGELRDESGRQIQAGTWVDDEFKSAEPARVP